MIFQLSISFFFPVVATLVYLTKMEKFTALPIEERLLVFLLLLSYPYTFIMALHLPVHIIINHLKVLKKKTRVNNLFYIKLWFWLFKLIGNIIWFWTINIFSYSEHNTHSNFVFSLTIIPLYPSIWFKVYIFSVYENSYLNFYFPWMHN